MTTPPGTAPASPRSRIGVHPLPGRLRGLLKGDPIYELRRTLDENRTSRARMPETVVTALVIKGWNAYREGHKVTFLRYRPGGANPEGFPEPR